MKQFSFILVLILGLVLTACGSTIKMTSPTPLDTPGQPRSSTANQPSAQDLTRSDSQGAVTVEVTPDDLSKPGDTFKFDVSMSTHSVDLSMDLAADATLSTDNGTSVQATQWDAPRGGHHVSGTLSFPANTNGKSLLDGATVLTLTIQNVDAAERTFTWNLP